MATQNNISKPKQADDFIRIQDLFYLCLNKWYWFVISLAVTVGVAVVYLLTTPPVYTRSASLLIKEDSKGNSLGDAAGLMGDFDLFQTNTNVNNEIQSLQSPAVMLDVVKRLHLDISYHTDGGFYKKVLYGRDCPYTVDFNELQDNESVAFTINPGLDGQVLLTDFSRNGEDVAGKITAVLNDTVDAPIGKLVVKVANDSATHDSPVYVSRRGYQDATGDYASNLSVTLSDEKSTVINLSFKDVCIQRAEDVLNTVIAVYNENWIKDKNQIAVSTSAFISDRLGVIEQELGNVDENISSYKSEHLLPDVQAAASMYMEQSSETNAQILALNTQLSMARYIRNYLTNSTSKNQLLPANSGIESPGIEQQILAILRDIKKDIDNGEQPGEAGGAGMSIFYGILWGVGGLTFGLSMRYLGVALGQSISLGTCAGFGTLLPALFAGTNLFEGNGLILLLGVCITLAGIAIIGYAGSLRAQNMSEEEKRAAVKDFALTKGLLVALLAGVMSACFALGLDAGTPIKEAALAGGVEGLYAGLPVIFLVTLGGFLTNAVYCLQQNVANKSMGDYAKGKVWGNNLVFCALAGVLWYMQFFGLEMGKSFLTESPVLLAFSWCILMALNVTFSNVWGIILKEWKGVSNKTITVLIAGLIVLIFSLVFPNLF